jgi:four helix bundle protein
LKSDFRLISDWAGTHLALHAYMTNPKAEELKARTKQFALAALSFRRTLPVTDAASDIGRQLSRAATSAGANYRAACRARSDEEFAARIGVVLEEADESAFWLEIVTEDGISECQQAFRLLAEANELTAIFAASSITVRQRLGKSANLQSAINLQSI